MDMPWNPAVLEQRIGRVHRMGQSRGVQVVNFVGQGSIEEGILSVLAFKKSLFAGVLDGGESEVFLQGTRLSKFMESVEQVSGAMGEADADMAAEPHAAPGVVGAAPPDSADLPQAQGNGSVMAPAAASALAVEAMAGEAMEAPAEVATPGAEPADPWAALLEAGAALFQGLATARASGGAGPAAPPITIERDPVTGQASVRLPLPDPAVLQRLAKAFEPWLR
jgi:hypothetical protein